MGNGIRSVREAAAILDELGIASISERMIIEFERSWNSVPQETRDSLDVITMLLAAVGVGHYDVKTYEWTPTSNIVYSFDVEVFDTERMYTLFLEGIQSINEDEFEITQIREEAGRREYPSGRETQSVWFLCDKRECFYRAQVNHDWFDVGILDYMNEVLAEAGNPKRLYFMSDGYQECIVFYCTEFWARRFEKKTGCRLYCDTKKA